MRIPDALLGGPRGNTSKWDLVLHSASLLALECSLAPQVLRVGMQSQVVHFRGIGEPSLASLGNPWVRFMNQSNPLGGAWLHVRTPSNHVRT